MWSVGISVAAMAMAFTAAVAAGGQGQGLRSLHLRMNVSGGDDFVFVEQAGADVRLRAVRVAHANEHCRSLVVQAVERTVRNTTVAGVAGLRVCAISGARVSEALKKAPSHYQPIDFFGSLAAVVADCDGADREFAFVMPPLIDRDVLRRRAPDVEALWDLGRRLRAVALGKNADDPFSGATEQDVAAREALGTTLVPFLRTGKYGAYLEKSLSTYVGPPPERTPSWVEIIDRATLHLVDFVEPVMHQIAISARVFGDVRVRLRVDPVSGEVTEAQALSGPPLLATPAVDALKRWRFAPGAAPASPVDVTVRFRLRCPGNS